MGGDQKVIISGAERRRMMRAEDFTDAPQGGYIRRSIIVLASQGGRVGPKP